MEPAAVSLDDSEDEQLRREREELRAFVNWHRDSVEAFRSSKLPYFKLVLSETDHADRVRHLTSTASCIESLTHSAVDREDEDVIELAREFADKALGLDNEFWESEGQAQVYCRVRALPAILRLAGEALVDRYADRIAELIRFVWELVSDDPATQGVYEKPGEAEPGSPGAGYPPNTFQTFWGLRCLDEAGKHASLTEVVEEFADSRRIAELWSRSALGRQIALNAVGSRHADSGQLAWGLACQFATEVQPRADTFSRVDVLQAAVTTFFDRQLPSGIWELGQPLFHYPQAGNAYCYTYETLTELLIPALGSGENSRVYRDLLRPQGERLVRAWHFARESAIELPAGGLGWCSQHHPHRVDPEAWATAAVFSYLQMLRRLVGIWSREQAERVLAVREVQWATRSRAATVLRERGNTWRAASDRCDVGQELAALFLNPGEAIKEQQGIQDPDRKLIRDDQARSAILFGPPGTSKTTLVEALAGALDWRYVEVHASNFLSRGMDQVPRQADEIFASLMELDHCVVLFDEIDELLRERQNGESDPFGRFLTTSMLPKVAKLWEQRRVLFFVATNDIDHADRAINRSQRFDASIFVAPPAFGVKRDLILERLGIDELAGLTEVAVKDAIENDDAEDALGFFALMRYDQVAEVADLARPMNGAAPALKDLRRALETIGRALDVSDWQPAPHQHDSSFKRFRELFNRQRRDHRMARVLRLETAEPIPTLDGYVRWGLGAQNGRSLVFLRMPGSVELPPEPLSFGESDFREEELLRYKPIERG
jgi:ATPase family associated with various cellular activities (AAA)